MVKQESANEDCTPEPNIFPSSTSELSWFFYCCIQKFIEAFYVGILGATDYWMRFEWQHHGSPHVHGLAWLSGAPNMEQIVASADGAETAKEELTKYVDKIVTTLNPAILPDGSK